MTIDEMWDFLLDRDLASEQTLQVVTAINGYSTESMQDILYAVTGYRHFEQYEKEFSFG